MRSALWTTATLIGVLLMPAGSVSAQVNGTGLRINGDVGPILMAGAGCRDEHTVGFGAGIDVRTRGPWILAAGADLWFPGAVDGLVLGISCIAAMPLDEYEGEPVEVWSGADYDSAVRVRMALGYAFSELPWRPEVTAVAGLIPTTAHYKSGQEEFSWEPWLGGSLSFEPPHPSIGLRIDIGRHRLPFRYYSPYEENQLVAEFDRWKWSVGTALSFRLKK